MLNLRKAGDNSHVPAVWFAAEPEDKRSNIRFVFYQEGIDMAAKKGASKTTAKTTVQTPVKTAEEMISAQTAEKKEEAKPAKVEAIETKAGKAKAIETKKDTTKAIETRAAVLQESEPAAEEKKTRARKTSAKTTTAAKCEMYLQFAGKEYSEKELMKKVKEVWTKELKHKVGELKDVKLYLKPEESAAYYVINKDTTGRIEL